MTLVTIANLIPDAILDMRYATDRNVTGRVLYGEADKVARLDKQAAQNLVQAATAFRQQSLRLVIWDAYRPEHVQAQLRAVNSDDNYVALHSNHCLGAAVDVTLATVGGRYLDMGTDFDEFSSLAHTDAAGLSPAQQQNRALLKAAMSQAGFQAWPYEWWHFDAASAKD